MWRGNLAIPGTKLLEPVFFPQHRLFAGGCQPTVHCETPQDPIAMENEGFLAWILPDLGIRIVPKDRIQHVRDMHQFMTAITRERRIVESTWNEFDADTFQPFFFELLSHLMFDGSPLPENVDAFLIFLEHSLDEHDSDSFLQQRIFVEGISDDVRKPPGTEHILVELLELTLTIVECKLFVDRVG